MAGPRMQSQGNRLNIMSRKSQKNLKRIPRVSGRVHVIPKGVREYHTDPRIMYIPSNHRIEPSKPKTNRQVIRESLFNKKTCTLTLVEGISPTYIDILTDDDRYRLFMKTCSLEKAEKFLQRNDPNAREKSAEISVFHLLVRLYEFDKVKLYIKYGMNVNHQDQMGRTALVRLVQSIDSTWFPRNDEEIIRIRDMIELLINNGVDPNIPDNDGNTCLHHCGYSNSYLFRLLVHFGCNKFHVNNRGRSPVCLSSFLGFKINEVRSLFDMAHDVTRFRKIDIVKLPTPLFLECQSDSENYKPVVDYGTLYPDTMIRDYCAYMIHRY